MADVQSRPSRDITSFLKSSLTLTENTNSPPLLQRVGPTNLDQYPVAGEISSTFISSSRPKNSSTSPGFLFASRAISAASRMLPPRASSILPRVAELSAAFS